MDSRVGNGEDDEEEEGEGDTEEKEEEFRGEGTSAASIMMMEDVKKGDASDPYLPLPEQVSTSII